MSRWRRGADGDSGLGGVAGAEPGGAGRAVALEHALAHLRAGTRHWFEEASLSVREAFAQLDLDVGARALQLGHGKRVDEVEPGCRAESDRSRSSS